MTTHTSLTGRAGLALFVGVGSMLLAGPVNAQVTSTALPFLTIPTSVESHAVGRISTLPDGHVMSMRTNPSLAGLRGFETQVQGAFYAPATDWLPGFTSSMTFSGQGLFFGFPVGGGEDPACALGVAYGRAYLDLGTFVRTLESPEPISTMSGWEEAHSLSVGMAYAGPFTLSLGMAFTFIRSNLAPFGLATEDQPGPTKVASWTYGATARIPLMKVLGLEQPVAGFTPFASLTSTLVISDVGGSVQYEDVSQSDPLPRAATMGLSASAGMRTVYHGAIIQLVAIELMREAQDILVERSNAAAPMWQYQSGLGDLRPLSDLLVQSGHTIVEHRKGFKLAFAESVTIMEGSFKDSGYQHIRTSGVGFSSRALFLTVRSMVAGEGFATGILDHVSLDYLQATYKAPDGHPLDGTEFQSFTVTIHAPHVHDLL